MIATLTTTTRTMVHHLRRKSNSVNVVDQPAVMDRNAANEALKRFSKEEQAAASNKDDFISMTVQESTTHETEVEEDIENGEEDEGLEEEDQRASVKEIRFEELKIGRFLGAGHFNAVHDVDLLVGAGDNNNEEWKRQYCVKFLRQNVLCGDTEGYDDASRDLENEAIMLSRLQHANIVGCYGVATTIYNNLQRDFLVLDKLKTTLRDRINSWRAHVAPLRIARRQPRGSILSQTALEAKRRRNWGRDTLAYRLQIGCEIASAFQYMHSRGIMHRDLKPDNVGFDEKFGVKIFDFGFARCYRRKDKGRKLTSMIGTRRYMAPEVAKGLPYNLSIDVYSFALVLWELCALETPFGRYSNNVIAFERALLYANERPRMLPNWSPRLQNLFARSWSHTPNHRPTFDMIANALRDGHLARESYDDWEYDEDETLDRKEHGPRKLLVRLSAGKSEGKGRFARRGTM